MRTQTLEASESKEMRPELPQFKLHMYTPLLCALLINTYSSDTSPNSTLISESLKFGFLFLFVPTAGEVEEEEEALNIEDIFLSKIQR